MPVVARCAPLDALSVGSKSLSGSGMSKVAMQIVRVIAKIIEKHIVPFAVGDATTSWRLPLESAAEKVSLA
jgi:hypothetical protein